MNLLYYLQYYTIPLLIAAIIIYSLSGWFLIKKRGIYITGIGIGVVILLIVLNMRSLNPPFFVFGDKEILKEMIINVEAIEYINVDTTDYIKIGKTKTLLHTGKKYIVKNSEVLDFKIYFSYQDSLIGLIKLDDTDRLACDHIHYIYVEKKNDSIFIDHISRKSKLSKRNDYQKEYLYPLSEYLLVLDSVSQKGETLDKFFDLHDISLKDYSNLNFE